MSRLSTLTTRDAATELWLDLKSRPARSALTALGTLIGIAVLVSTLGLAASLDAQIATRFDQLTATQLTVADQPPDGSTPDGSTGDGLATDAPTRVRQINGTLNAALLTEVKTVNQVVGTPGYEPGAPTSTGITIYAASTELAATIGAELTGVFFDQWHDDTNQPVAVLGRDAADRLRIDNPTNQPVIFLDGHPTIVIGILDTTNRKPELLQAVIVPTGYATRHLGLTAPTTMLVTTDIGAADTVAAQAGLAIRPEDPDSISAQVPPSPDTTREQVSSDTQALFLILGAISLIIGGIGIANMTLVSVLERIAEIGLRRAIGARRRHVVMHFLLSSTALGLMGAIAGTALGMIVTTTVALGSGWPPTMHIWVPPCSPLLGIAIGLAAGAYPAHRASRIEPIEALRASG